MEHDQDYKLLFSQRDMVADLLQGLAREDRVRELDFGSLERVGGNQVPEDIRELEYDIVWRIRRRGEWLYVLSLIEFQSKVDRYLAVRVLSYVGMLYEDFIRTGELTTTDGRLPAVLPIVLYERATQWESPEDAGELLESLPGELGRSCPRLRVMLPDDDRYAGGEMAALRDVAATLIRPATGPSPDDAKRCLDTLSRWLRGPEESSLEELFVTWLTRNLLPRRIPGVDFSHLKSLQEVQAMLSEHIDEWKDRWKRE